MLRSGMSLDDINKAICNEMNAAQKKLDAEKKAKEEAFKKEEAARKAKEEKEKNEKRYFNAAVAALGTYLTVVSKYEYTKEEVELAVRSAVEGLILSKKILASLDKEDTIENPNGINLMDIVASVFDLK
jgi:Skp family chaperone for outer membrane proteins